MRAKTYFGKVQKARTGEANPHYSAVRLFAALPQLPEPWPDHLTRAVQSARKRVLEELFNCLTTLDSDKLRKYAAAIDTYKRVHGASLETGNGPVDPKGLEILRAYATFRENPPTKAELLRAVNKGRKPPLDGKAFYEIIHRLDLSFTLGKAGRPRKQRAENR